MELIEPRRQIMASAELHAEFPTLATALEDEQRDLLPGVWRDGDYYLFGSSTTDDCPEELAFVMTRKEFKARGQGKPIPHAQTLEHAKRAMRMYPELSILGKMIRGE